MSHENTTPESTYPPLERPTFTSQIPPYLLEKASDSDKYILAQLSTLSQFIPWAVTAALEGNALVRKTNGRLIKAEADIVVIQEDRVAVRSGWKAIFKAGAIIGGAISFVVTLIEGLYYLGILGGHK